MGYRVAVVGATGSVGREICNILAEREFPADEVVALASRSSIGKEVALGDRLLKVKSLDDFDFTGTDIALFSAGSGVSADYGPKAAGQGCIVIDNSSYFRMVEGVPLVVPECNAEAIGGYTRRNIIANPNCSATQMVVALKPLHDLAPIKRVVVATYQSVSGAGKDAMDELFRQTRGIFVNDVPKREQFSKQIAFNVIPQIDVFMDDGATREEWKMVVETKKILDPAITITATCVRVPVFVGHGEAINVQFRDEIDDDQARELLRAMPGVTVIDHRADDGYVTPVECAGEDQVFVSRIRSDPTIDNGLNMWVVSDNLRKGAALNAVQIAETLIAPRLETEAA